jgi:hypothetical protein
VRRAHNHRDANEPALLEAAGRLGAVTVQGGPLDVWAFARGMWVPVEIKNPEGRNRLQPSQIEFRQLCERIGAPTWLWRTEADVIENLHRGNR